MGQLDRARTEFGCAPSGEQILGDQRRGNQQNLTRCAGWTFVSRDLTGRFDEQCRTAADVTGLHGEPVFGVVGAQHDDAEVERHVGLDECGENGISALVIVIDRIGLHGCAGVQSFLDHVVLLSSEQELERARPAVGIRIPSSVASGHSRGCWNRRYKGWFSK